MEYYVDKDEFAALFLSYQSGHFDPKLYVLVGLIVVKLGGDSDLHHDVWVNIIRNLGKVDAKANVFAWVSQVAKRTILWRRRNKKHEEERTVVYLENRPNWSVWKCVSKARDTFRN